MEINETLMFYDDELHADSCILVQDKLEEHFKLAQDDVHVQVYYEKKDDRVIIGMTIFSDKKEDRSRLFDYRDEFEKYYKHTFSPSAKMKVTSHNDQSQYGYILIFISLSPDKWGLIRIKFSQGASYGLYGELFHPEVFSYRDSLTSHIK